MEADMAAEIAEGTIPHYEDEYVEFEADINGDLQLFRVDVTVFEDMLHMRGITRQRMKELFVQNIEYFLDAAERKFATVGRSEEPLVLTQADLRMPPCR
jgi:hypothetical protein